MALRHLAQDPPHDLARTGLRQRRRELDRLRLGDRADLGADVLDQRRSQLLGLLPPLDQGDEGVAESEELRAELIQHVRTQIGPIAKPEAIQFAPALPKTRSGKIMRRILRKVAEGNTGDLGDTSTLADPSVVDSLVAGRS